jgi:type I restriction enzyme S subunit
MTRLGDIAELRSEKVQPSEAQHSTYIGLEHIQQQTLTLSGVGTASDVSSQKQRFYRGDVLFGKLRPYFRKVVMAQEEGICSTDIWVVRPKDRADSAFILYLLASEGFVEEATNTSEGSRMPRANWRVMREFDFPNFTATEREKIGRVLRNFDEKIGENRRVSVLLEETAQALFKSWFIDFDPVKAKMAGEAPFGMDAETAALFPDSMEDSELGEIPTGWHIQHFDYWAQIISGGTPKTSTESYWNGNIPWFSVADAPSQGGVFFVKTAKRISEDGLEHSAANLVRPGVAILSARGTVGKVAMVAKPSTFNQSCFGIEGKWGDGFNYLMVKSQVARLQGLAHGGMFDTITRETFKSLVFPFAGAKIVEAFNNVADPIFDLIRNFQFENETLGTFRDSLLPRLISGELEIPDELLAA